MNQFALVFGLAVSVVMVLLLILVTVARKNISGVLAFRGYLLFGVLLLLGLYMIAVGLGVALSPVELRQAWDGPAPDPTMEYRGIAGAMNNEVATRIVTELASEDERELSIALGDLKRFPPDTVAEPIRRQVEAATTPLLDHEKGGIQGAAANALVRWGTSESAPQLIEVARDEQRNLATRRAALKALAAIKDPRALEPLAELAPSVVSGHALAALKEYGSDAEPVARKLLDRPEEHIQIIGCNLLAEVGTADSLERLDNLSESNAWKLKAAATKAGESIRKRTEQPPEK